MNINLTDYNKDYVIINSDRIIMNSKDDCIISSARKFFIVSANDGIHFNIGSNDTSKKFIVNSPIIEFGLSSKGFLQPIAKGDETVNIIKRIIKSLQNFSISLEKAVGVGAGTVSLPIINSASTVLKNDVTMILNDIQKIKSKTTYSI